MRGYFVHDVNEEYGIAIVARTAREAKKIGAEHLDFDEYTDLRVNWQKEADVSGLLVGRVDNIEALHRGLYGWAYTTCEICGKSNSKCEMLNGIIACLDCIEKSEEGVKPE